MIVYELSGHPIDSPGWEKIYNNPIARRELIALHDQRQMQEIEVKRSFAESLGNIYNLLNAGMTLQIRQHSAKKWNKTVHDVISGKSKPFTKEEEKMRILSVAKALG